MKLLILVVAVIVGAQALTEEQKEKLLKYDAECIKETGVSQESLNKIRNHEHVDDPKLKDHAFCILKKSGLMTEDGNVNTDVLKTKLKDHGHSEEKVNELVTECGQKKDTPQETAAYIFKCFYKNRKTD